MITLGPDIPSAARHWRNHPDIRRWCRQFTLISEQDHSAWLCSLDGNPKIKMFSVLKNTKPIGVCGLTSIDHVNQKAEFSLYIAPEFQGGGHGYEALIVLLDHGFNSLNINRIWGESFDGNPAQKIFERAGMAKEGSLHQSYFRDGKFIDSHIWATTRSKFNARYRNNVHSSGLQRDDNIDVGFISDGTRPADEAAQLTTAGRFG